MDAIDNSGPAFPISDPMAMEPGTVTEMKRFASGMTLRDYFAAKAIPSMLHLCQNPHVGGYDDQNVAQNCYLLADAMIAARGA